MSAQAFLNLVSIVVAFIASLFFCVGSAEMKATGIKNLAGTYWDGNPHLKDFLISLKADYLCGGIALCLAFLIQFIANVPAEVPHVEIFANPRLGAGAAILVGLLPGVFLCSYRRHVKVSLAHRFEGEKGS